MKPKLDDMKTWPIEQVLKQHELELAEHREIISKDRQTSYKGPTYEADLTRHYRLSYMQWLLDGQPQPVPRFV